MHFKVELAEDKTTAVEAMSVPYFVVKMGVILKELKRRPKYMADSDKIYDFLESMVIGIRFNQQPEKGQLESQQVLTKSGGITLFFQPPVIEEEWMMESQKWTDIRRPLLDDPRALPQAKEALYNWLDHEVVWASGISGSTDIDMNEWYWLNFNEPPIQKTIDKKAAFLGVVMFLVYDGGHSISEVLWAANSMDKDLGLDFKLSDESRIEAFLPDFNRLIDLYTGTPMESSVTNAFAYAFDYVLSYYREHPNDRV